jgi:hypothetical protein
MARSPSGAHDDPQSRGGVVVGASGAVSVHPFLYAAGGADVRAGRRAAVRAEGRPDHFQSRQARPHGQERELVRTGENCMLAEKNQPLTLPAH